MEWLLTRPYVTAFLGAFLYLASRRMGWWRTLTWLVTGYGIALLSEACAIRTGIPYGLYTYQYEQLAGDLLLFGVPVWDSLSYPFLIYAGWSFADGRDRLCSPWRLALGGAGFTMLLDVVIDPVARLGERWFLGQIYAYAQPGWYFGVPLSNFAGWFIVPWAVIALNQCLWHLSVFRRTPSIRPSSRYDVGFYLAIALFNIAIAFAIGAWWLGLCSCIVLLLVVLTRWRFMGTSPACRTHSPNRMARC